MADFSIKRGATLLLALQLTDDYGQPIDLTTVTLSAQLRDPIGLLVEQLAVVPSSQIGFGTIRADDTAAWPISRLLGDVKVIAEGITLLSDSFAIRVSGAQTQ